MAMHVKPMLVALLCAGLRRKQLSSPLVNGNVYPAGQNSMDPPCCYLGPLCLFLTVHYDSITPDSQGIQSAYT